MMVTRAVLRDDKIAPETPRLVVDILLLVIIFIISIILII